MSLWGKVVLKPLPKIVKGASGTLHRVLHPPLPQGKRAAPAHRTLAARLPQTRLQHTPRRALFPGGGGVFNPPWENVTGLGVRHSCAASRHHDSTNVYPAPATGQALVLSAGSANTGPVLSKRQRCKSSSACLTQNRSFSHSAQEVGRLVTA